MIQDRFGFMWLGTQNGLVRYDGYSMTVYQPEPDNPKSISDNMITTIYEDREGTLWVGTRSGGLNKFNRSNESFTRFQHDPLDSTSISSNYVANIYEDSANRLWVVAANALCLMDRATNTFTRYYLQDWLYGREVYEHVLQLEKSKKRIASIVRVGNNANSTASFSLSRKTQVLLTIMGESSTDYGWLENDRGVIISHSDSGSTLFAGGRSENRVQMSVLSLDPGGYRIRYKSDSRHSYNNWVGEPPSYPEFWGIQVFDISGEVENIQLLLGNLQPMNLVINSQEGRPHPIIEDRRTGNLFVGGKEGLLTFDVDKKILSKVMLPDRRTLGSVQGLRWMKYGGLWIASDNGLSRYDPGMNALRTYKTNPTTNSALENSFFNILEDPHGLIWVGHYTGYGFQIFDPKTEMFRSYGRDATDPLSSISPDVLSLFEDRSGIVWVGMWHGGLAKWDRKKSKFNTIGYDLGDAVSDNTLSIYEDSAGWILLGTANGVVPLHGTTKPISSIPFSRRTDRRAGDQPHLRGVNRISRIVEDRGVLWICSLDSGLVQYNYQRGVSTYHRHTPGDPTSLAANEVRTALVDHKGVLWVGTVNGLSKFDRASGRFVSFRHELVDTTSVSEVQIDEIYEDSSRVLWVGTNLGGLNRYDRRTGKFTSYRSLVKGREASSIGGILEDQRGNFWVGTYMTGLHLFDRQRGMSIRNFTEKDGLANNAVHAIVEDNSGLLWISTDHGLSRFDPRTQDVRNFWIEDGLTDNGFQRRGGRGMKTLDGRIILFGKKGLTVFHPDSIKDDPVPPLVAITNISLFNRPDEKLALNGYVPELQEASLLHNQNDLHFDFVGLHFGEPARNRYKYMLEGFDEDWVDAGTQRNATYTNLDPGEYTFKVLAANRDGVWSPEAASLRIVISPPWWATWWAYALYVIVIGSALYGIRRSEMNRQSLKHRAELEHVEAEKLRDVNQMKSNFFANISHEFRTPLTLILGPIQKWQGVLTDLRHPERALPSESKGVTEIAEVLNNDLGMMERSASRLLRLINQLLDLSKLEAGGMKLQAVRANIVSFVKGIASSFESSAGRRGITLTVEADADEIELYFDRDKLEKVFVNLLSNAFKFTQEGGSVTVTLTPSFGHPSPAGRGDRGEGVATQGGFVTITVTDTGVGIPGDQLDKIFDRFYQVDASQTREHEGTGIGLALTKELVELHHGSISVKSEVGKGTEFTVRLPLGREHLREDEIVVEKDELQIVSGSLVEAIHESPLQDETPKIESDTSLPLILVVEDNADVRAYIRQYLDPIYQVLEAKDGLEGVEKAKETVPDLIISDVMMPKMDGNELCKTLKLDEKTSHIPIILLTAKAGTESKIAGLETGADDYLVKPFDAKELLVRVKNLIDLRRKLRERFSVGQVLKPGEIAVTSVDDAFLQKAMATVENEIGNEHFGVEELACAVNMSRSQLFRKLTAVTNQSPRDFIRYIRLHRGMDLLKKNAGTVSEVAYAVGFNSVTYFTKCFHEQFGQLPSDVRKLQQ